MRSFDGMLPRSSSRGVPPSDAGSNCKGFSVGSVYIGVCMAFVGGMVVQYPTPPLEGSKMKKHDVGVQKHYFVHLRLGYNNLSVRTNKIVIRINSITSMNFPPIPTPYFEVLRFGALDSCPTPCNAHISHRLSWGVRHRHLH